MRRVESKKFVLMGLVAVLLLALVPTKAFAEEGTDMYRMYNMYTGEHLYTSDYEERDALVEIGWAWEGVGWVAPNSGKPVYRLYNAYVPGGDHHYTMSAEERDDLVKVGWSYEGVGWYSRGNVPVYRQFNPYATTGTHNYTTGIDENNELVELGWIAEGVGWYALKDGYLQLSPNHPMYIEHARTQLKVPDDPSITYEYYSRSYSHVAGMFVVEVAFYQNGKMVAHAKCDPVGFPMIEILEYTPA